MKNNEKTFSKEKLKKAIKKLNSFINDPKKDLNDNKGNEEKKEKEKKILNYINKYSASLKDSKEEEVLEFLLVLAENLSEKVYEEQGDEIMEDLWKLYKINTDQLKFNPNAILYKLNSSRNLHMEINNNPEYFLNLVFMNENFTKKIIDNSIIIFDKEKKEINFTNEIPKILFLLKDEGINKSTSLQINNILDLIFLKIMCIGNMKTFYTILSSMLMLTEGKTVLIFKLISFFALCLFKFENKESFIGSLLFIIGAMLRDYAKSYMKTKGLERVIFSEHKFSHKVIKNIKSIKFF